MSCPSAGFFQEGCSAARRIVALKIIYVNAAARVDFKGGIVCRPGIFGLGVADGVYMWKTKGIDSGLFSRTLMSSARENVKTGMNDVVKCESPPRISCQTPTQFECNLSWTSR